MKTTRGLYVHIPFCLSKCTYCDFYSVAIDTNLIDSYVDALVKEIELASIKNNGVTIDTIYFGGGTPSVLPLSHLEKIIASIYKNFKVDIKEFTIEANPATKIDFAEYRNFGIDRISLGVQSLDDRLLKIIGRKHNSSIALNSIDEANKYFDKVSCDLMVGLPTQTLEQVKYSANVISSKVKHVSMYMLKLSNEVKMAEQISKGIFSLPDDDTFVDFYEEAYSIFKSNGLSRYEISNFSISGYESLHNLKYWNREEYIGLGASAHGFIGNIRYYNPSNLKDYIAGINYGNGKEISEIIDYKTALFEKIMLAFRLPSGIDIEAFNKEFNVDFEYIFSSQLKNLKSILVKENKHIFIKEDKLLLESAVAREFLE